MSGKCWRFVTNGYIGLFIIFLCSSELHSQVTVDEDVIPYGLSDGDLSVAYFKNRTFQYEKYTLERQGPVYQGQTTSIEAEGMNEKIYSGIGGGLDVRIPLLYMFIHKNKKRLRIADDIALGTFLCSNKLKVKDALHDETIEPEYNNKYKSSASVSLGYTVYVGIQATYRISDLLDVGVKYTPLFATYAAKMYNSGSSYGFHLRVKRIYFDYRLTPYKMSEYSQADYETKGMRHFCVKYLLPDNFTFRGNGYVFASLNSFTYKSKDPYETGGRIPTGYENYTVEKSHLNVFKIGIGLIIL